MAKDKACNIPKEGTKAEAAQGKFVPLGEGKMPIGGKKK